MHSPSEHDLLRQLEAELTARGWRAHVQGSGRSVALRVVNPEVGRLSETVACRRRDGEWSFYWSWDQLIGPAADVSGAADRIQFVLCGVAP